MREHLLWTVLLPFSIIEKSESSATVNRHIIALAALALMLGLTACTKGPTSSAAPHAEHIAESHTSTGRPSVGDCWQLRSYAEVRPLSWHGATAVDCATPHNAITYAVVSLPAGPYPKTTGNDVMADNNFAIQLYTACEAPVRSTLGATALGRRFQFYSYLATAQQWDSGQRWARCDVVQPAIGSMYQQPVTTTTYKWDLLSSGLSALRTNIAAHPDRYRSCLNSPSNAVRPDRASASLTYANCTAARWLSTGLVNIKHGNGEKYPGDAAIRARLTTACKPSNGSAWSAYGETAPGWSMYPDADYATCWHSDMPS